MANTIITKNSSTAAAVPTAGQLVQGELAVNVTDKRIFTENSGGTVVELGVNPSSVTTGNATVSGTLGVTGLATLASSTLTANPTLSSGTANGVTYLNGSKVLTSGSALTFDGSTLTTTAGIEGTKLTTAGNINLYNSVSSQLTHYQQLSSSYTATSMQSVISGASASLTFSTASNWTNGNAAERMRITSAGNVGIGTTNPIGKLTVSNAGAEGLEINAAGGTASLTGYNRSGGGYVPVALIGSGGGSLTMGSAGAIFSTDLMVGDTSAQYSAKLYVNGAIAARNSAADGNYQDAFVAGYISNYTERNIIQTAVAASGVGSGFRFRTSDGAGLSTTKVTLDLTRDQLRFYNDGTERMRLDSGNLMVGQTAIYLQNSNSFSFDKASGYFTVNHLNLGSGSSYLVFGYNSSQIGSITQNGTSQVLYNISSDYRLKENIQDAESAAALIDAIQVRQYNWKSDGLHQRYGFVAQELVNVAPEAVHQPADPEEMMAVDYSKLVPMLVKEIQSLRQRLAAAGI